MFISSKSLSGLPPSSLTLPIRPRNCGNRIPTAFIANTPSRHPQGSYQDPKGPCSPSPPLKKTIIHLYVPTGGGLWRQAPGSLIGV
ncbi:hypothetical protein L249_1606 [Ophiocordyceps polyrhachis-furcata BCC 54312]|uniref:Uncharacterized protein n=1 Tax=Ophiocordyceps polyrhachis-furcata BCC 54312 TaxID=1330021 RepID=A0A367KZE8_9HYPO|nr:hypothetical protein L249_1606 [Ophiocordyceps polyrhachis-furcata BCC 54312]